MPVLEVPVETRSSEGSPFFFAGPSQPYIEHHVTQISRPIQAVSDRKAVPSTPNNADSLLIRGFDVMVATMAIVALLPLMLLIALMVRMASPGPAIFCQQRVGRNGQLFPCLKFRSMVPDAQDELERLLLESEEARLEWEQDQKLRNDPRVTPLGEFLRKTSLDELPQLFNILAGHMSIVGPRPIVESEIARYGSRFPDYCSVRPGLTGLWQISGRNDVSYGMRVRLDSLYAHRQSLALNVAICVKTVPVILTSRGCY